MNVPPLRARIHTLDELQRETLQLCEAFRKQLKRESWQDGLNDDEFLQKVVGPLETKIRQDREMATMMDDQS